MANLENILFSIAHGRAKRALGLLIEKKRNASLEPG
jgi:hypothetical protein